MSARLQGKVAIVSAAAGAGMGQVIARTFGQEGAEIVVTDAHEKRIKEVGEKLSAELGREVLAYKVDVRDRAAIDACVKGTLDRYGRVDILYNNAGINKLSPVWELTDEDWTLIQEVNLGGSFRFSRAVLPHMFAQKSGVIINVSSIAGWHSDTGGGGQAAYAAAKAGVMALTRATAAEVGRRGVRVNAIAPGTINNPFLARVYSKAWIEEKAQKTVFGRMGTPEEVASVAVFLASDESRFISGEVIDVSAGQYMHA